MLDIEQNFSSSHHHPNRLSVIVLLFLAILTTAFLTSETANAQLADTPWPMYKGNLKHTSLSPYTTQIDEPVLKWKFETNDGIETSPAIGSDGTIYFGSWDRSFYAIGGLVEEVIDAEEIVQAEATPPTKEPSPVDNVMRVIAPMVIIAIVGGIAYVLKRKRDQNQRSVTMPNMDNKSVLKKRFYSLVKIFLVILVYFFIPFTPPFNYVSTALFPLVAILGLVFLVQGVKLTLMAREESGKRKLFLMLTGISAVAPLPFAILHNLFYGLAEAFENFRYLFEALDVASFIIAIVIAPITFIVGIVGSMILFKSKVDGKETAAK